MVDPRPDGQGARAQGHPTLNDRPRAGRLEGRRRTTAAPGLAVLPTDRPQAVLFDLDDTLFDHTRALTEGLRTLRRAEPALRRRPFVDLVERYEQLLDRIQPGPPPAPSTHAEARALRFAALAAWLGVSAGAATAERWSSDYREAYQANRHPVPGVTELLRRLSRQVTLGIVTNNHTAEQEEKLEVLGLGRWFDFMITSESCGLSKPDPRIYRLALERAAVAPAEAVMVGDNWVSDVEGALAAGIPPVWLNRWREDRALPPTVRSLRSFRPLAHATTALIGTRSLEG
jgi:HAD superfamily hydrolase (TIGR01549 family)